MLRPQEPGEAQAVAPDLALVKDEMDAEEYDMSQHGQEQDLSALKHEYYIEIEEHDVSQPGSSARPELSVVKVEAGAQELGSVQGAGPQSMSQDLLVKSEVMEEEALQPGSSARPELAMVKVEASTQELGAAQGAQPPSLSPELLVKREPFEFMEESQTAQEASSHSVVVEGLSIKIEVEPILDESSKLFSSKVVLRDSGAELQQSGSFQLPYSSPCTLADHDSDAAMLLTEAPNKKEKIKCNLCEYTTCATRNSRLKRHMMTHTGDKAYKCDHCQYSSARSCDPLMHKWTHISEKPLKCNQSQYSCSRKGVLAAQIKTHTGEKPFKCDNCHYSGTTKRKLILHMRAHTGEKPYKCDQCQYSSARDYDLLVHKRIHTGKKPYKCDQCQYRSARRDCLAIHKRKHTDDKPYKCDQCQYRSAYRSNLAAHKRTHLGVKSFKCDQCQYTSKRKTQLLAHTIMYTGEKGLLTCGSAGPAEGTDSFPVRPPAAKTYSRLARK